MDTAAHGAGTALRRLVVLALAALAALAVGAGDARAGSGLLTCPAEAQHPFLRWLDPSPYTLVDGGDFEDGAAGWELTGGARVAAGNHSFGAGSSSLVLPAGSSATSPPTCVQLLLPTVRFYRAGGGLPVFSSLKVEVLYTDLLGRTRSLDALPGVGPSAGWAPTLPLLQLGGLLDTLRLEGLTGDVRFRLSPRGAGTWRVDDLYADPWKTI